VSGARALDGVAGFVEAPCFYPYLSGRKNLELCAAYDGGGEANRRIDESLDLVDLADRAKDRVGSYSHGMKQRLGIAGALIRNPKLLVLDEPTTGLDPAGMRDMRELVRRLASEGLTVMLSSHLMSEVEELCNRVAIIRGGSILFDGELDELLKSDGESRRLRSSDQAQAAVIATRLGIANRIGGSGELELTGGDDIALHRRAGPSRRRHHRADHRPRLARALLLPAHRGRVGGTRAAGRRAGAGRGGGEMTRPKALTVYLWELRKLARQKRTYLGLGAAVIVPICSWQRCTSKTALLTTSPSAATCGSRAWPCRWCCSCLARSGCFR
jgi:ABC-type Na+ transport system ATPase subunit NatA